MIDFFYFARHAETPWNRLGITMGKVDIMPSDEGLREAHTSARLCDLTFPWIVSSSLQRATITAKLFQAKGVEIFICKDWEERDWGRFEGRPKEDRRASLNELGIESIDDFNDRIKRALFNLPEVDGGLVVSHSGVFRALLSMGFRTENSIERLPHSQPILLRRGKSFITEAL